ncbi:MAG: GreA/GreB family elongation factor, partial [Salinisphaera sp.]|nr:GreA/GreB family elongation factor [Salinisphaera sp.]
KLANARIVDVAQIGAQAKGRIVFGALIVLADEDTGDELKYQIVGEDEADIKAGLLSYASPIARAVIGKTSGDVVEVEVPGGRRTLEVVEVQYQEA